MKPSRDEIASKGAPVRRYWPNYDCLFQRGGVLYQRWMLSGDKSVCYNQLLVPRGMQKEVIEMCHDTRLGGHLGATKLLTKYVRDSIGSKLGNAVRNYIRKCPVCCANRHPQKRLRAALKDYRVGHPQDRIGVDVLGPSNNQQRKLLHPRSSLVEAYLMPDQQAGTTATKLVYEFISRYSVPLEVHTDQGRNFESNIFQEVCKLLEIKNTRTTPYRPASNGLVERFNRTLAKMIQSFSNNSHEDWDLHLPFLTFGMLEARCATEEQKKLLDSLKSTLSMIQRPKNQVCVKLRHP